MFRFNRMSGRDTANQRRESTPLRVLHPVPSRRWFSMLWQYIGLVVVCLVSQAACQSRNEKLILISMDSLMYDFLKDIPNSSIANFYHIVENGVLATKIMNVFPTLTYPNHYTLITGLYPESHGMVSNYFYDPELQEYFDFKYATHNYDSKWYDTGAEPIYVTNNKAGDDRRSGSVLFPTGMARVKGIKPDRMVEDDGTYPPSKPDYQFPYLNMPYSERVERTISWLTDEQNPINLGLLYFPEPDELSHEFGPTSAEVRNEITGPLNDALGLLIQRLKEVNLYESTNIILTADHGQTSRSGFVYLDDYLDPSAYTHNNSIATFIYPVKGKEEEVYQNLSRAGKLTVYKKGSTELRALHFTNSDRIAPIVLDADEGIVILRNEQESSVYTTIGLHGYNPQAVPLMKPVFMAMGPGFKEGYVVETEFNVVDIYPLMCHLLDITPAPNNGSLDNVRHLLAVSGEKGTAVSLSLLIGGLLIHDLTSTLLSDM